MLTARYILPFVIYVTFLAVDGVLPLPRGLLYTARLAAVLAVLVLFSRPVIDLRASRWFSSILLGIAVFVIWVGPDLLWPGYRQHWLFTNWLAGSPSSTLPEHLKSNVLFLALRFSGSVLLVPVAEELFWRAWMMRWLVARDFTKVPLGTYGAESFWLVAVLFASEHGPFWDVGLAAGILYNWWMIRTRSLGDCILAHAVTNACLGMFVLLRGDWAYWL